MSAAVSSRSDPGMVALGLSVLLHGSLLLLPLLGVYAQVPPEAPRDSRPNSVAMLGNSIEVEAPTPELASPPPAPPAAATPERAEPEPVDVRSLPAESNADASAKTVKTSPPARPRAPVVRPAPSRVARPSSAATDSRGVGSAATASAPAAGTFGQEGLAPGVRRLGYAFTRAIPAATPADEEWRRLPAGRVGTIRIELEVNDDNRLGELRQWQARRGEPAAPPILKRMVERTLLLLRAGQFALSGSNQPGAERLVIDVQTRDEAPEGDAENEVVQKKFDGASPGRPGKAYFRYGSGRVVEATVTIVPAGPR